MNGSYRTLLVILSLTILVGIFMADLMTNSRPRPRASIPTLASLFDAAETGDPTANPRTGSEPDPKTTSQGPRVDREMFESIAAARQAAKGSKELWGQWQEFRNNIRGREDDNSTVVYLDWAAQDGPKRKRSKSEDGDAAVVIAILLERALFATNNGTSRCETGAACTPTAAAAQSRVERFLLPFPHTTEPLQKEDTASPIKRDWKSRLSALPCTVNVVVVLGLAAAPKEGGCALDSPSAAVVRLLDRHCMCGRITVLLHSHEAQCTAMPRLDPLSFPFTSSRRRWTLHAVVNVGTLHGPQLWSSFEEEEENRRLVFRPSLLEEWVYDALVHGVFTVLQPDQSHRFTTVPDAVVAVAAAVAESVMMVSSDRSGGDGRQRPWNVVVREVESFQVAHMKVALELAQLTGARIDVRTDPVHRVTDPFDLNGTQLAVSQLLPRLPHYTTPAEMLQMDTWLLDQQNIIPDATIEDLSLVYAERRQADQASLQTLLVSDEVQRRGGGGGWRLIAVLRQLLALHGDVLIASMPQWRGMGDKQSTPLPPPPDSNAADHRCSICGHTTLLWDVAHYCPHDERHKEASVHEQQGSCRFHRCPKCGSMQRRSSSPRGGRHRNAITTTPTARSRVTRLRNILKNVLPCRTVTALAQSFSGEPFPSISSLFLEEVGSPSVQFATFEEYLSSSRAADNGADPNSTADRCAVLLDPLSSKQNLLVTGSSSISVLDLLSRLHQAAPTTVLSALVRCPTALEVDQRSFAQFPTDELLELTPGLEDLFLSEFALELLGHNKSGLKLQRFRAVPRRAAATVLTLNGTMQIEVRAHFARPPTWCVASFGSGTVVGDTSSVVEPLVELAGSLDGMQGGGPQAPTRKLPTHGSLVLTQPHQMVLQQARLNYWTSFRRRTLEELLERLPSSLPASAGKERSIVTALQTPMLPVVPKPKAARPGRKRPPPFVFPDDYREPVVTPWRVIGLVRSVLSDPASFLHMLHRAVGPEIAANRLSYVLSLEDTKEELSSFQQEHHQLPVVFRSWDEFLSDWNLPPLINETDREEKCALIREAFRSCGAPLTRETSTLIARQRWSFVMLQEDDVEGKNVALEFRVLLTQMLADSVHTSVLSDREEEAAVMAEGSRLCFLRLERDVLFLEFTPRPILRRWKVENFLRNARAAFARHLRKGNLATLVLDEDDDEISSEIISEPQFLQPFRFVPGVEEGPRRSLLFEVEPGWLLHSKAHRFAPSNKLSRKWLPYLRARMRNERDPPKTRRSALSMEEFVSMRVHLVDVLLHSHPSEVVNGVLVPYYGSRKSSRGDPSVASLPPSAIFAPHKRRKVAFFSHVIHEELLLPFWLAQQAQNTDHAVIVDYNSTDNTLPILFHFAPAGWQIVERARMSNFRAIPTDQHIVVEENEFPGWWKLALTVAESLVAPQFRQRLSTFKGLCYGMTLAAAVGQDPMDDESNEEGFLPQGLRPWQPLPQQRFVVTGDLTHQRFVHSAGPEKKFYQRYHLGRHSVTMPVEDVAIPHALVVKFQTSPWPEQRFRKEFIKTLTKDLKRTGFHHKRTFAEWTAERKTQRDAYGILNLSRGLGLDNIRWQRDAWRNSYFFWNSTRV